MPCGSSPFGCQIRSKAQAYGFHQSFAQFWTDGEAAYGKTDGSVCIAGEITDADEARAFLRAVGTTSPKAARFCKKCCEMRLCSLRRKFLRERFMLC